MSISKEKSNIRASWLHISDLHVFLEADTNLILEDYTKLAKIISPQFFVITGDFRHIKHKTNFHLALNYLESILKAFHIEKKDTFLVPGNHDANSCNGRNDAIIDICQNAINNYNIYSQYLNLLYNGFSEYESFIFEYYKNSGVTDARVTDPSKVYCILWNNSINILSMNTALISDGNKHKQIVDINALSNCYIDPKYPTIMLGHHWLESVYSSYSERIKSIIDRREISAYLHGDIHKYNNNPIQKISVPNRTIPSIACSKSAPQSGDSYSDIGVIYYEWENDNNVYVQAYKWSQKGFVEDSVYSYDINKKFNFPMICNFQNNLESLIDKISYLAHTCPNKFMKGEWVNEAELIWKVDHNEVIGRSLLLFYYNKASEGIFEMIWQAQKIFHELEQLSNCEQKTQQMLHEMKKLLFFGEQ